MHLKSDFFFFTLIGLKIESGRFFMPTTEINHQSKNMAFRSYYCVRTPCSCVDQLASPLSQGPECNVECQSVT